MQCSVSKFADRLIREKNSSGAPAFATTPTVPIALFAYVDVDRTGMAIGADTTASRQTTQIFGDLPFGNTFDLNISGHAACMS